MPVGDLSAEAERRQREALVPDKMRDNPGFGKPLHLEDNPYDQGMGMAYRILRNAGFRKLPWMDAEEAVARGRAELAAAVDGHLAWLRAAVADTGGSGPAAASLRARHRAALDGLRARAETLRRQILTFNLTVPIASRQVRNVNPDRVVAAAEEAAAPLLGTLARHGDGARETFPEDRPAQGAPGSWRGRR